MKVLLSGLSYDRVELSLARSLAATGIDLFVLAVKDSIAESMCRERGIPFASDPFPGRVSRATLARYRALLDEHRFDLVHCLTNRALSNALLAVRPMKPRPAVIAYRGTMGHLSWFDPASHMSYLNRRLDAIICVSDAVRRYLKTFRIPDEKLAVIWKGHDPSWYAAAPRSRLADFDIPADAVTACFTGNIRPVKGILHALDAFDAMDASIPLHLLVIGDVRDPAVRKRMGTNPRVHFTGYLNDAASVAGACDIAVMPSIEREGLPKAVLESMAQGVPPVVTDVGGMPELVIDGQCGLVVPPKNATALRDALLRLAADPDLRIRMGAAARERVEGDFNFRHTVDKTLALYRRVTTACSQRCRPDHK